MWICPSCSRIFSKANQSHSCKKVLIETHFVNKPKARTLFEYLLKQIKKKIGKCKTVSIPCCIHLFGSYDFLAVLPKKDCIEVRFVLQRKVDTPRIKKSVPISSKTFKNCLDISSLEEIDEELVKWIKESYHLRNSQKHTKNEEINDYINKQKSPQKEICTYLRKLIHKSLPNTIEEMKWGAIVFGQGKFYVASVRDSVNLGFCIGGLSEEEASLFSGRGKMMRHLKFRHIREIDSTKVIKLLKLVNKKATCDSSC